MWYGNSTQILFFLFFSDDLQIFGGYFQKTSLGKHSLKIRNVNYIFLCRRVCCRNRSFLLFSVNT